MTSSYWFFFSDLDYSSVSADITFDPSTTNLTLCETISLLLDTVVEPLEVFTVQLSSTDPDVVIQSQQATVAIQDESVVDIEFAASLYSVQEADGSIQVCAELSGGTLQRNILVDLATQDSTASGTFSYYASLYRPMQYRVHFCAYYIQVIRIMCSCLSLSPSLHLLLLSLTVRL